MPITSSTPASFDSAFTRAGLRRGIIAALPFIISNGVAGMIMGVAYKGLGLGFAPAVLFSVLVYSGTAQAVTLGMWASPPPVAALILACIATNARYLVMSAHLRQYFGGDWRRAIYLWPLPPLAVSRAAGQASSRARAPWWPWRSQKKNG